LNHPQPSTIGLTADFQAPGMVAQHITIMTKRIAIALTLVAYATAFMAPVSKTSRVSSSSSTTLSMAMERTYIMVRA
jgi:hypothetical protein